MDPFLYGTSRPRVVILAPHVVSFASPPGCPAANKLHSARQLSWLLLTMELHGSILEKHLHLK